MAPPQLSWLYVFGGICCSALAQICLKRATFVEARQVVWFAYIAGSLLSYAAAFAAYYLALRAFSISRIAPVMTVGVVLIVVTYGLASGESLTVRQAFGVCCGIAAIALLVS